MSVHLTPRVEWGLALGAAVLAAALLGAHADVVSCSADAAHLMAEGRAIALEGWRPLVGPAIGSGRAGHWTGPLVYYLHAVPYFLRDDPAVVVGYFAFLRGVAHLLWWRAARVIVGPAPALAATAVGATLPAHLNEQLLLPMLSLPDAFLGAFALVTLRWGRDGRGGDLGLAIVLLGALVNLHVSNASFLGVLVGSALLWRRRPRLGAVLFGMAGALTFWVPWLVTELGSGWENSRAALAWLASRGTETAVGDDPLRGIRTLARAWLAPFTLPQHTLAAYGRPASGWSWGTQWLDMVLVGLGTALAWAQLRRGGSSGGRFLVVWSAAALLTSVLGGSGVYSFHLMGYFVVVPLLWSLGLGGMTVVLGAVGRLGTMGAWVLALGIATIPRVGLFLERVTATRELGYLALPPESVLSAPDRLWSVVVPVRLPMLRDVPRVAAWWKEVAGPESTGRLHGITAQQLAHSPPYFARHAHFEAPTEAGAVHWWMGHRSGGGCRSTDVWLGPYCARPLPSTLEYATARRAAQGGAAGAIRLPAELAGGAPHRVQLVLAAGGPTVLVVATFGPYPVGVGHLDYPAVTVTLAGRPLTASGVSRGAMLLLAQEVRYSLPPRSEPVVLDVLTSTSLLDFQMDAYVQDP